MKRICLPLLLLSLPVFSSTHAQQPPPADKPKWDVTADLGPTTKLSFDTSEGTWMNVDVSPDGRRIVFDLLGDLYTMPIAGSPRMSAPVASTRCALTAVSISSKYVALFMCP